MNKSAKAKFFHVFDVVFRNIFLFIIRAYQLVGSPHMGGACRFQPTCSHYGLEAFRKHNFFTAFSLTTKRILRCHPFGAYGFDPLPEKQHD